MSVIIPNDLPNGHEKSYRRGFADGYEKDRRTSPISESQIEVPDSIPNGHEKSYRRGYLKGQENSGL